MSKYKTDLIKHYSKIDLNGGTILSIGSQVDDRSYFHQTNYEDWVTMDIDQKFRPEIVYDINQPLIDGDGMIAIDPSFAEKFDVVLALNLWEYIWNPLAAHDNIAFFLKAGGVLYTNYQFVYPLHEPRGMDYMRITPDGAVKLLTEAGFVIEEATPIIGNKMLVQFYQTDGMKMRAGEDHTIVGMIIKAKKI